MIKLDYFFKIFTKSFDFQCFYSVCFYFEKNSSNLSIICQLYVEKAKIEGSWNITYLVAQFCKASSGKEWWETYNKSQKTAQNGIFGNYSAISCQTKTVKCSGIKDFKKLPIFPGNWRNKEKLIQTEIRIVEEDKRSSKVKDSFLCLENLFLNRVIAFLSDNFLC